MKNEIEKRLNHINWMIEDAEMDIRLEKKRLLKVLESDSIYDYGNWVKTYADNIDRIYKEIRRHEEEKSFLEWTLKHVGE